MNQGSYFPKYWIGRNSFKHIKQDWMLIFEKLFVVDLLGPLFTFKHKLRVSVISALSNGIQTASMWYFGDGLWMPHFDILFLDLKTAAKCEFLEEESKGVSRGSVRF